METNKTLLLFGMAVVLLAGCGKQEEAAPEAPVPPTAATAAAEESTAPAAPAEPASAVAAAPAAGFDIASLPVSSADLPAWPYTVLPSGYALHNADNLAKRTKDLARVPVWAGGQLLWVEGKVFSDRIQSVDGKTFSKFELNKGLREQIESLGGVRVSERSYDRDTYKANEKELDDFRQEFGDLQEAYWYDTDVDTYAIRRADGMVWVVLQADNNGAAVLVAEGPLPTTAN